MSATGTTISPDEQQRLRKRLVRIARLMDSSIRIPVVGYRIGLDGLIGLLPGVGDAAGGLVSAYIVVMAARLGVPRALIWRMAGNVGVETLVGAVPVLGDVFDMAFRANLRNVSIMEQWLESQEKLTDPQPSEEIRASGS